MISIKEAGRYANFLKANIELLQRCIVDQDLIYKVTETHLRSKVLKDAEDTIEIKDAEVVVDIKVEDGVFLLKKLIDEKMMLAKAIRKGKSSLYIDWEVDGERLQLDEAVEYAKNLRECAQSTLSYLATKKNEELIENGIGYMINKEGNQTQYFYDIKIIKQINYDRNIIKAQHKSILKKADKLSEEIDRVMIAKAIDYEMEYSFHDSLEDIATEYVNKRNNPLQ